MTKLDAESSKGFREKLTLGASSWGNDYGLFNPLGIDSKEVNQILQLAARSGITRIDTAPDYGESEIVIGFANATDFQIYSKVSAASWQRDGQDPNISIHESLKRLGAKKFAGLMFHSSSSIFNAPKESIRFMQEVVGSGVASKWGVSVYEVEEVERLLGFCKPDFIQLPSSLADRRFVHSGMISQLSEASIEVHTRSILLQGLILQGPGTIRDGPRGLTNWAYEFEKFSSDCGLSKLHLALLYNLTNSEVSEVIVGVNSLAHLEALLETLEKSAKTPDFDKLPHIEEIDIIDPRRWPS